MGLAHLSPVNILAAASSLPFSIFLMAWSALDIPLAPLPDQVGASSHHAIYRPEGVKLSVGDG